MMKLLSFPNAVNSIKVGFIQEISENVENSLIDLVKF